MQIKSSHYLLTSFQEFAHDFSINPAIVSVLRKTRGEEKLSDSKRAGKEEVICAIMLV